MRQQTIADQTSVPYFVSFALLRTLIRLHTLSSAFVTNVPFDALTPLLADFGTKIGISTTLRLFAGITTFIQLRIWRASYHSNYSGRQNKGGLG